MLRSTLVGNYPRLPSSSRDTNIRRKLHLFDKQEITRAELTAAFDDVTRRVLNEQRAAGVDLPTDGQIRWDDLVTPIASRSEGFEIGGLIRWFDNNVYYRRPRITAAVRWREAITARDFKFAQATLGSPVKAVLPAPYSFARLCEDQHYRDLDRLLADLAALLRAETKSLIDSGAQHIQFDDPCVQFSPDDASRAIEALNNVIDGLSAEFWVCFYFGRVTPLLAELKRSLVHVVAVDCVSHAENFAALLGADLGKNACFGLLEARNIKMESAAELHRKYAQIAERFPDAYLSPSAGLEFLPHQDALRKTQLLGASVQAFNQGERHA